MTPSELPDVSIVIRTALDPKRKQLIYRAIDSITTQQGVRAIPILVANGDRYDPALLEELSKRDNLQFTYIRKVTLSDALVLGREQVNTPFFGFLDDDDYYLPGALKERRERMNLPDRPDVVVTTGVRRVGSEEVPSGASIAVAKTGEEAALRALFENAWLTPAGGIYRSDTVSPSFFAGAPPFHEWTFLACRMVLDCNVAFLEAPGYFMNDTEVSESKSFEYDLGAVEALERMLALRLPESIRPIVERKLGAALHFASLRCTETGDRKNAWRYHWRSLTSRGGLRYLSYTRRLFARWVAASAGKGG